MSVPAWKFWHPLPFWQVLLVAIAAQLVCTLPFVALEQLGGVRLNPSLGGAGGGLVMFFTVRALAQRKLRENPPP